MPSTHFLRAFLLCAFLPSLAQQVPAPNHAEAYIDYLRAYQLAEDGSRPEALRLLAQSLRLEPGANPAAPLAFELLTEQRARSRFTLVGHTAAVNGVEYSPDGRKILTYSTDNTARIWDADTGRELTPPLAHGDAVIAGAWSRDGKRVLTGSEDHTARIWDAATGRPLTPPIEAPESVLSLAWSRDGKLVALGTENGHVRTYEAATGRPVSPETVYHDEVYSLAWSPDGTKLLTGTSDGTADVLDPATGKQLLRIRQTNIIFHAEWSPDGSRILTSSANYRAALWTSAGSPGPVLQHAASVDDAVFNADATRIATTSWDHTARVWDAATGQPVTPPLQHSAAVLRAAFSPDNFALATSGADGTARLWNTATGDPLRLPLRIAQGVSTIAFRPGRSSYLVAGGDGTVYGFDEPPSALPPAWLADLAEFAATQTKYNQSVQPDLVRVNALRTQLTASAATDPWSVFGRWYFAESGTRGISPWSTVSLEQYVAILTEKGDRPSLELAHTLSGDHPQWTLKLLPLLAKLPKQPAALACKPD